MAPRVPTPIQVFVGGNGIRHALQNTLGSSGPLHGPWIFRSSLRGRLPPHLRPSSKGHNGEGPQKLSGPFPLTAFPTFQLTDVCLFLFLGVVVGTRPLVLPVQKHRTVWYGDAGWHPGNHGRAAGRFGYKALDSKIILTSLHLIITPNDWCISLDMESKELNDEPFSVPLLATLTKG